MWKFSKLGILAGVALSLGTAMGEPVKSGAGMNGIERSGVKPYKHRVEYLESTGTQWIDTGFVPTLNDVISLTYNIANYPTDNSLLLQSNSGGWNSVPNRWLSFKSTIGGNIDIWAFRTTSPGFYQAVTSTILNKRTQIICDLLNHKITIARSGYSTVVLNMPEYTEPSTSQPTITIGRAKAKYIFCSIERVSKMLREFQPVRFTNEQGQREGAMYDRVTGELFRNQGTGAFVIGPDKR